MVRIYTRGGDKGKTGIHGGERVDKDDIRIEANGTLDELNALLGIVRTFLPSDHEWQALLGHILLFVMARYEMFSQGEAEERWKDFLYKRRK